jgi:hypothetical protein
MSNEELYAQGLHAPGYSPGGAAAGGGAPNFTMGGGGTSTAGAAGAAGAAAAGAAGRGLSAPSGAQRWLSKTLGPSLAHYPNAALQFAGKHPAATGVGGGMLGMHEFHNYEDAKKREAIANMGAMDRLQAALGLVFNPQATANRLY